MEARHCRATRPAPLAAFAVARPVPRGPRPEPVVPTTGLARCRRKRRVPVVAAAEQAYPRLVPLPAVPRHPVMKVARSDPRMARLLLHLVDHPSYFVVVAAERASPIRPVAAAVVVAVVQVYPIRRAAAERASPIRRAVAVAPSCPSRPVVAERQPEYPRRVVVAVAALARPSRQPVAVARRPSRPAAEERPSPVVAAAVRQAFPSRQPAAVARRPSRPVAAGPSLPGRADRPAASASCWH